MPHRLRKIRKKRGSRTQGWGRVGQHRKTGSKGRRNPGRHKALWSYIIKYEPEYYGKRGFTSPRSVGKRVYTVNVGVVDALAKRLSAQKEDGMFHLDLGQLGYDKLLGGGKVRKALVVKVASSSKSAVEKIGKAGGQVLTETQGTGE